MEEPAGEVGNSVATEEAQPAEVPPPLEQAQAVKSTETRAREAATLPGTKMYIISSRWFNAWCQYSGFSYDEARKRVSVAAPAAPGPAPGPIDSQDLLTQIQRPSSSALTEEEAACWPTLRGGLVEKKHFWALCEPTWDLLRSWYGVAGPVIVREYMQIGLNRRRLEMDPGQLHVKIVETTPEDVEEPGPRNSAVLPISELCTVMNLLDRAAAVFGAPADSFEAYDASQSPPVLLGSGSYYKTLRGMQIKDQQAVHFKRKQAAGNGTVLTDQAARTPSRARPVGGSSADTPSPPLAPLLLTSGQSPRFEGGSFGSSPGGLFPGSPLSRSGGTAPGWAEDSVVYGTSKARGLAGLSNLGNTCFMNSSVQCLTHTVPVMDVFLSGAYLEDCNSDNPLGLGGKMARAFGSLLEKLWKEGASHVTPKHFKWQLSRFAPQFSGYAQQDSQELLAFLLDGLHEDLNRIRVKPYIEEPDSDGRPDAELAAAAWAAYRARNDSVIVDHFQGMYKSTLVCPRCNHSSVKFDPFMYLSLPLPHAKVLALTVTVLSMDSEAKPLKCSISVPSAGTVGDAVTALARLLAGEGGDAETLVPRLLLACWTPAPGGGELDVYTEPAKRLASALPLSELQRQHGYHMPRLLAYLYTTPPTRDGDTCRTVIVHHRAHYTNLIPCSLFFVPESDIAKLPLQRIEGSNTGLVGTNNVVTRAVLCSLRPYQVDPGLALGAQPLDAGTSLEMEDAVSDLGSPASTASAQADSEEPMISDIEMDGMGGDNDADNNETTHEAPDADKPFDMFSMQSPGAIQGPEPSTTPAGSDQEMEEIKTEPEPSSSSPGPGAAALPDVVLKVASGEGRVRYSLAKDDAGMPPVPADDPLCFVADWGPFMGQHYSKTAWESPEKHSSITVAEEAARKPAPALELSDCVEAFLQAEQLDAEDSWYCSKCKEHVQANKKLDLWSLPEVLVVHLKRFSYSRTSRDKLDTAVSFPFKDLDLGPYLLQRPELAPLYDLYAVSNHYGGLGGGHYTAYCKMPGTGAWYVYDDSSVRKVPESQVLSPAAYVLFYRRKGSKVDIDSILQGGGAQAPDASSGGGLGTGKPVDGDAHRSPLTLETIDSDDDLIGDPMHEELDIQ